MWRADPSESALSCESLLRLVEGRGREPYARLPPEGPFAGSELHCLQ